MIDCKQDTLFDLDVHEPISYGEIETYQGLQRSVGFWNRFENTRWFEKPTSYSERMGHKFTMYIKFDAPFDAGQMEAHLSDRGFRTGIDPVNNGVSIDLRDSKERNIESAITIFVSQYLPVGNCDYGGAAEL